MRIGQDSRQHNQLGVTTLSQRKALTLNFLFPLQSFRKCPCSFLIQSLNKWSIEMTILFQRTLGVVFLIYCQLISNLENPNCARSSVVVFPCKNHEFSLEANIQINLYFPDYNSLNLHGSFICVCVFLFQDSSSNS